MSSIDLAWLAYSGGYLLVGLIFLFIAKTLYNIATPFCVDSHLTEKDNPALGIHFIGFILGILAVVCSVFYGHSFEPTVEVFLEEIKEVLLYGGLGVALVLVAGLLNDKLVLSRFNNRTEIIDKQNTAVATLTASTYLGSGLVIAAAIYASIDILSLIIFFIAGQVILCLFMAIYKGLTKYDDQHELGEKQNFAVSLAIAGNLIAYSVILMKGIGINPELSMEWSLQDRLLNLAYYAIGGILLLGLARLVADFLFMPKAKMQKELVEDRNVNAGLLEGGLALSVGMILSVCL